MQFSARANVVARRSYNRPLNDEGTVFETWEQTITRVIGHQRWLWERAKGAALDFADIAELNELKQLMLARKVCPSGRTLWLGGTETAKLRQSSQFNPGRRSTKFITDKGVKSFEDFEDGDTVVALTHLGNWKQAKVIKAGVQPINRIEFYRGSNTQVEYFTPTHTWILQDGTRTQDLKVGDRLHVAPSGFYEWQFDTAEVDEKMFWAYGFVYGDGTITRSGQSTNSMVRLCGAKANYLERFIQLGFKHSYPPSAKNDPFVYTGKYYKTLPDENTEVRLLRAFIRGYLDADGAKNNNEARDKNGEAYITIQATDPEAQRFIETMFPVAGLYIINKREVNSKTNLGERSHTSYNYAFRSYLGGRASVNGYTVRSIEPQGDEEVWCLTVDDDHSFVLPNGIVTGNCSFARINTVHDVVDGMWLLLQGCGVGFEPVVGTLNGFSQPIPEIEVIRSKMTMEDYNNGVRGHAENRETVVDGVWTIVVGDSAEAWAKAAGKLLAQKAHVRKLVLDFSQIRAAGIRLKGYGWISSGDATISIAFKAIAEILNRRAGKLLTRIDILDIMNWLGTTLSSRRSAEIALVPYGDPEWEAFAMAKMNHWENGNSQRAQSNNSLVFYTKPTKTELRGIFAMMQEAGGSEPGFFNGAAALKRAPWFKGTNP